MTEPFPLPPSDIVLPPSITDPVDILSLKTQMLDALAALEPDDKAVLIAGAKLNGDLHMALVVRAGDIWTVSGEFARSRNQGWTGGIEVMATWK